MTVEVVDDDGAPAIALEFLRWYEVVVAVAYVEVIGF